MTYKLSSIKTMCRIVSGFSICSEDSSARLRKNWRIKTTNLDISLSALKLVADTKCPNINEQESKKYYKNGALKKCCSFRNKVSYF